MTTTDPPVPGTRVTHRNGRVCVLQRGGGWAIHTDPSLPEVQAGGVAKGYCSRDHSPPPEVVTLCGSTRFKDAFTAEQWRLSGEGIIVLSVAGYGHIDWPDHDWTTGATDLKRTLDALHFRKIDMSDRVHVIDVDGYVGESTANEIAYATRIGLPITYLSGRA